jgi:hypothetical protein
MGFVSVILIIVSLVITLYLMQGKEDHAQAGDLGATSLPVPL